MTASEQSQRARTAAVAFAWGVAVVLATLVGMTAVGVIGSGIVGAGRPPLTPSEVDAALASARSEPPAPSVHTPVPSATPTGAPAGGTDVVSSPGGTVVVRCSNGTAEVVSVSPAQGFRVHGEQEGGRIRFESERTRVEVRISCRDEQPVGQVEIKN